ncbi:hypothetical protein MKW92_002807 [Papaver armeniacum]|nr:hypothetical protein MKW92_002807 [Papaver armeniacum]
MSHLVRNAYKSVASGLKYHTMNQRLLKSAHGYEARYVISCGCTISSSHSLLIVVTKGELSKVIADYQDLSCPEKGIEVLQVLEEGKEFGTMVDKLYYNYTNFKLQEEPNLTAVNMLRDYVLPSAGAATLGILLGEIAYRKHLKEKYQGKLIILFHSWGKLSAGSAM